MLSIASIRAAIGAEFKAATTEVETEIHRFVDFIEGKAKSIADAEALLKAEGFTVIDPSLLPAATGTTGGIAPATVTPA